MYRGAWVEDFEAGGGAATSAAQTEVKDGGILYGIFWNTYRE
jgi:hypothetical protein